MCADPAQRKLKIGDQRRKRPRQGGATGDNNKIEAGARLIWQYMSRRFAKPAAGAVAGDRITNLAAGRKADPDSGVGQVRSAGLLGRRRLENQTGRRPFSSLSGDAQKLRPPFQAPESMVHGGMAHWHGHHNRAVARQAERRLRPLVRRRARIRRPPGVARRARNPWRRLRTRALG